MMPYLLAAITLLSTFLFSGCGIGSNLTESNVTLSIRVSALTYIRDNNETNETICTIGAGSCSYVSGGRWDYYDANITGMRIVEKGMYLTSDGNCSISIDENATAPTLKAPMKETVGSRYGYINVNPFTTLLVDGNYSLEELRVRFATAASIDEDFNFDTVSTRHDKDYLESDLTPEICEALEEVIQLQN